jgi:microcystin-dependent protein
MPANPVLGQIMPFAGSVVPRGWAVCNGALLSIQQNTALFSLIGTTYGGDGMRNFALPNLCGRAILGADNGAHPPGLNGGAVGVTLQTSQIPAHNHVIQASTTQGSGRLSTPPLNNLFAVNTEPASDPKKIFLLAGSHETNLATSTNVVNDGGSLPHNNMQPYLTISYLIALTGIYPSRD